MTVGIDGGYVREAHKEGCFEVIAGRSVVSFRRAEGEEVPPVKCFGFVQTFDQKPRRRLWELMKSQGMQENQQVVFLSDGGEDVRRVQEYLHPNSEHLIDWFHITMRLTVLQQQTKSLRAEQEEAGTAASKQIESIKHLLWHGNAEEAVDRLVSLSMDLDLIRKRSASAEKLSLGVAEFETYIRNDKDFIPNFGERYRQGETISTAFVESTINQLVSRRFVKKQQMQWTQQGAHLLPADPDQGPEGECQKVGGQGGSTPDFLTFSEAVAGVAIFPNFSAEQGAHGFTDFNDLGQARTARCNPTVGRCASAGQRTKLGSLPVDRVGTCCLTPRNMDNYH
jgi:hypothetical protein